MPQRQRDGRAQHWIVEQWDQPGSDTAVADVCHSVNSRKSQEEVPRFRYAHQLVQCLRRTQLAQRFNSVIAHVGVFVVQRLDQGGNRAGIVLLSQGEGCIRAQFGIFILQELDQRVHDVDID